MKQIKSDKEQVNHYNDEGHDRGERILFPLLIRKNRSRGGSRHISIKMVHHNVMLVNLIIYSHQHIMTWYGIKNIGVSWKKKIIHDFFKVKCWKQCLFCNSP